MEVDNSSIYTARDNHSAIPPSGGWRGEKNGDIGPTLIYSREMAKEERLAAELSSPGKADLKVKLSCCK
jgi:hypothetical protein